MTPKCGDLIKITGEYLIKGAGVDETNRLKNKIAIVLNVKVYGLNSIFGEYYKIEGLCNGKMVFVEDEDLNLINKELYSNEYLARST